MASLRADESGVQPTPLTVQPILNSSPRPVAPRCVLKISASDCETAVLPIAMNFACCKLGRSGDRSIDVTARQNIFSRAGCLPIGQHCRQNCMGWLASVRSIRPRMVRCVCCWTWRTIQYQWTLLEGINDSDEEIEGIVRLLSGKYAMMNLIP